MKALFKSAAIFLAAFSMTFSPALMSMANAGGINYEGFSSYGKNNNPGSDDEQTRGLMFNFSFGGPKDYKQNSSVQDIYKASLTSGEKAGIFFGIITAAALILYITDDDDACPQETQILIGYLPSYGVGFDGRCQSVSPSDRRLKEDIVKVGLSHQGLPLYTFRYIGTDRVHVGVMAQDVLQVYPEAVLIGENGYYMVDYGKLGLAHLLKL